MSPFLMCPSKLQCSDVTCSKSQVEERDTALSDAPRARPRLREGALTRGFVPHLLRASPLSALEPKAAGAIVHQAPLCTREHSDHVEWI